MLNIIKNKWGPKHPIDELDEEMRDIVEKELILWKKEILGEE